VIHNVAERPKDLDASQYYKIRLDQTLQHTQQATRLIYLVNGAVLGALYFLFDKFPANPIAQKSIMICALVALGFINLMHAFLILSQGRWYGAIDAALAKSVKADPPIARGRLSTHRIHAFLYFGLASLLVAIAAVLFCWWQT
jgi:hypothetical protein